MCLFLFLVSAVSSGVLQYAPFPAHCKCFFCLAKDCARPRTATLCGRLPNLLWFVVYARSFGQLRLILDAVNSAFCVRERRRS